MPDKLTGTYSSIDWNLLSREWKLNTYLTVPQTNEPLDKPTITYHSPRQRPFSEVMEEVLERRSRAWERLADL